MVRTPPPQHRFSLLRKSAHQPLLRSGKARNILAPLRISPPRKFGESTRQYGATRSSINRARYPYSYGEAPHEGVAQSPTPDSAGCRPTYSAHIIDNRGGGRDNQAHALDIVDNDSDNEQVDLEMALFHWEEEDTLFSDLMNERPESEDTQLDHLAESLQFAFNGLSTTMKKEMASTIIPTVNKVKRVHKTLDESVDRAYSSGLAKYNKVSKNSELKVTRNYDDLRVAYRQIQLERAELLKQLEALYAARAHLWSDIETKLTAKADAMRKELNALPEAVEDAIASMEKQSKHLELADPSALDKKLKSILG